MPAHLNVIHLSFRLTILANEGEQFLIRSSYMYITDDIRRTRIINGTDIVFIKRFKCIG